MTDFFAFDLPNAWFLSPANIFSIAIRGFKVDLLILMFGQGLRIIHFLQLFQGILRVYRKAFAFQK